jgi:UDP-N-acetylglucosamine 2-epimerase (non-hydrolysing)
MITVMTIFGTRPEAIKLAPVIKALEARPERFRSIVCVTGQHREMLDQVLRLFEIEPDFDLDVMTPNQTLAGVTASVLTRLDPVLESVAPDWVLVQGDTTTAMTASLAAFYRRIKVGHVEAGLRTGDKHQPFPEEINRRITSVVADLHFAPTKWAASNLRREGIPHDRIVVTGNTVIDAIQDIAARPFDPRGTFPEPLPWQGKRLILVTAHRRENFGQGILDICAALATLATTRDDIHMVYPVHPNPSVLGPVTDLLGNVPNITLLPPLDYQPMVWLMQQSYLVISDSGGIQEEAPGLGKPVLVLRETTERPEGVESGTVRLIGTAANAVITNASELLDCAEAYERMAYSINSYGDGMASVSIANALACSVAVRVAAAASTCMPTQGR